MQLSLLIGVPHKLSISTANALLSPREAYLISKLLEGGLFRKLSDKDIFGSFSVLLSHILQNQHTILWLKYVNSKGGSKRVGLKFYYIYWLIKVLARILRNLLQICHGNFLTS